MTEDAVTWLRRHRGDRPWLVLGKGPSLDKRHLFSLDSYQIFALNHACRVHKPRVAHFTDLEAFYACLPVLEAYAATGTPPKIVLPWVPHVAMGPGEKNLAELLEMDRRGGGSLFGLFSDGHLLSYNSTRVRRCRHNPGLGVVRVRYFSAVPACNILALAGVQRIHTLGVDGGSAYARDFDPGDKLANGRSSFDIQFRELDRTCKHHRIVIIPLAGNP